MTRNHGDSEALDRAIEEYGCDAFEKEAICPCEPSELNELEELYIRKLGIRCSMGSYNSTFSGEGQSPGEAHPFYGATGENHPSWGRRDSKETSKRMGEGHRGITDSEEARQKISQAMSGKRNPCSGIKSEQTTSNYCGICAPGKKYRVLQTVNRKLIDLGCVETEGEAAMRSNSCVLENGLKDYP